jgi:uncharacterized MAPEG superfamily protein
VCRPRCGRPTLFPQLLVDLDLFWLYGAWYICFAARAYCTINANATRAPARLDRPDQHVYRVAATGQVVLMDNEGVFGRFNRAQRACANADETLPMFITGLLLQGFVTGPLALCLALLWAFGRTSFARLYTKSLEGRGAGFLPAVVAEHVSAALVLLIAVKSSPLGYRLPL